VTPKPTPPPPAPVTPVAVDAVRVVRAADPPTCGGAGQPHDWRYQYGVADRPGPPFRRLERFHCTRCAAIEDRAVPPLGEYVDGPQFGSRGS
jgi:hypothetical protein